MTKTQLEAPAANEVQIQRIVEQVQTLQDEILSNKSELKEYKVRSDVLDELKAKKKEIQDSIEEEKERIVEDLGDDYSTLKAEELDLSNKLKSKLSDLRVALVNKHAPKRENLFKETLTTKNGQLMLGLEFSPVLYFDGKELK